MQSALMLEQTVGSQATINVSQFTAGMYVIVANGTDSQTFVKE